MEIQKDVSLGRFTTFHLGGPARYFARVTTTEELREAIRWSKEKSLAFFILGGGSNILFRERGFDGLVIKIEIEGIQVEEHTDDVVEVIASAGESWDGLIAFTVARGLYGLENLSAIPGTVGAAPVQNIGAYGAEVQDVITWVEALDTATGTLRTFSPAECMFGYRDSFFKRDEGRRFVITRVTFGLTKRGILRRDYKDVAAYFSTHRVIEPTLHDMREAVTAIRSRKFPDLSKTGTAGSFFKNPMISKEHHAVLVSQFGDVPSYPTKEGFVKVPIAWFLDLFGWKDVHRGSAGTWPAQPLVLVHYDDSMPAGGTDDVLALADEIEEDIRKRTGIVLEKEVYVI